jgi:3-hydroxy-3-methylglutaryl CoA synthase
LKGAKVANTSVYGITGYGGYIPRLRMQRTAIAAAHKWMAPSLKSLAKGQRAFCSWDEDSVTMAVEASRDALGDINRSGIGRLYLSSTTLPFADLQHSAIVSGALDLSPACQTLDTGSTQRAGTSALLAALQNGGKDSLLIASEQPKGKPGSTQEISYGAGAAAFTLGSKNVIAHLLGAASQTSFFVDHFRASGADHDYVWEERWIRDEGYMKLVPAAVKAALAEAKVNPSDISHFVMPSPMKGIADAVAKKLGLNAESISSNLEESCGYTGSAHSLLMLAHVLEKAAPGQIILVVGFGQGCDALLFKVTEAITQFKPRRGVSGALADALVDDSYLRMLSYGDGIELEWGMRAEKAVKTPLTEQYRSRDQLASFMAGKCTCCQLIQFPQMPYCVNPDCNASREKFEQVSLVDVPTRVLTYTADWLSYHPSPPLYVGFAQFDNGARLLMETVDVGPAGLDVGTPLKVVFRIKDIDKTRSYPRYFWKTTPIAV